MRIGDRLNQRYTLTAHLGSGAMGAVYQASDSQTSQTVAVKILDRTLTLDPEMVERFKREGETLRQLRHRHIVSFIDTFQHEGQQVIVMEYVGGGSLHALIKRGPLPVEQARQIAIDLCDALTSAHRLNIIHRDIKPENVLLAADGTSRLTDFGVARLVSEGTRLTGTGTQIGTPFYMSPEAWQGQPLDAQTDIWSLGVMLHEMLTGEVPFAGETLVAVMNKVLTAPLPDLKKLRPDTPPALVKIVRRMLERDKARRYSSLRLVAVDLEAMGTTPIPTLASTAAPQTPAAQVRASTPKPPVVSAPPLNWRRWGWAAGGLALVVCLLGAGGTLLTKGLSQAPSQATVTLPATPTPRRAATSTLSPAALTTSAPPTHTLPPSDTARPTATPRPAPTQTPTLSVVATLVSAADGMVQVYVPAGDFLMGSTDADIAQAAMGCPACDYSNEKPQHTVYLEAFWIDQTKVTQGMYAQCMAAGKCVWPAGCNQHGDNYPMGCASRTDAANYCGWVGRRLPTEAEWEKAARGTDGRLYPWGNTPPNPTLANYNLNVGGTTEVGQFPQGASPYGALDMAGNLWEFVADRYSDTYYQHSPARNPTGPEAGTRKVLRGSSYANSEREIRVTTRWIDDPAWNITGAFRCAAHAAADLAIPDTPTPRPGDTAGPPTATSTPGPPTPTLPPTVSPPANAQLGDTWPSPTDGMPLRYVPAGDFLMGATDLEILQIRQSCPRCKIEDQKPQHTVYLDAFWIDQTEVTNAMYAQCVDSGQCQAARCDAGASHQPSVCVGWANAQAYCAWAGRRLPTEAQWEKAARGTDGRLYPWGNQPPSPTRANYGLNLSGFTDVGKYPAGASPYGALDMAGNAWEWVADWYEGGYYGPSPASNPPGPATGTLKGVRGGSWNISDFLLRVMVRAAERPSYQASNIGFRCAVQSGK